jgi:hypothetical protein
VLDASVCSWPHRTTPAGDQALAQAAVNRELFLVSDVLATLRRSDSPDGEVLHSIERFIAMEAAGSLDLVVTLAQMDGRYIIADGNKRAMAYYESRRGQGSDAIALPVFLVIPA